MNDLDLCLGVVSRSRRPLRYIRRWISRKPLETETWVQTTTNRKWPIPSPMPSPMVTWPMTSRDPERWRSWPQYVWYPLSRKWLEIAIWWQWSAYRKRAPGNRMVTWPMTSRDPERSRSWPKYVWCPLSRKWLEIATWWQSNGHLTVDVTWPWNVKVLTPMLLEANISRTVGDTGFVPKDHQ